MTNTVTIGVASREEINARFMRDMDKLKQAGVTRFRIPTSERKEVDALMASADREWAEGLDAWERSAEGVRGCSEGGALNHPACYLERKPA